MSHTIGELWTFFAEAIIERLDADDDTLLWRFALDTILASTDADAAAYSGKDCIITEIGRCSHWIRPHWRNTAGTAWPFGYGNIGGGFAYASLPQFDWSLRWLRDPDSGNWQLTSGQPSRRPLVHRIAVPARTSRHPQAAIHTIWIPGAPTDPKNKLTIVHGFAKSKNQWRLRDRWDRRHD